MSAQRVIDEDLERPGNEQIREPRQDDQPYDRRSQQPIGSNVAKDAGNVFHGWRWLRVDYFVAAVEAASLNRAASCSFRMPLAASARTRGSLSLKAVLSAANVELDRTPTTGTA